MSNYKDIVRRLALDYWHQMVENGNVDAVKRTMEQSRQEAEHFVDVDTIEHTDAREVGAEWICLQAVRELQLDTFLQNEGWNETQINTTLAHLIVRTICSPSEHKSLDIMRDNSAVCELLTGNSDWQPTYHSIYNVAPALYALKEKLDNHLCRRTDNLFNITNRIVLLKTDLNLRPIYHQKDESSDAHLYLGLLAYQIVNTIRYKLKQTGETCYWTEIKRRMTTQKAVTTEAVNALGEKIKLRLCSTPTKVADNIYERLKYKKMPFYRLKIPPKEKVCSTQ